MRFAGRGAAAAVPADSRGSGQFGPGLLGRRTANSDQPLPGSGWRTRDAARDACAEPGRRVRSPQPRRPTGQRRLHRHRSLLRRPVLDGRRAALPFGGSYCRDRRTGQSRSAAGVAGEPDDGRRSRGSTGRRPLHHRGTRLWSRRKIPTALRRGRRNRRELADVRADLSVRRRSRIPGGRAQVRRGGFMPDTVVTDPASPRAEVCAVACADLFRDAGEIMVSPMTNMASVGARLARLTFSPDILLTDGEAQLLADTPALGKTGPVEGWMPFGRVFETLAWGRRHVVMGANQVDRHGNQNISAFGPLQQPKRQMFGVRGAPGNAINHATSYWVGNHSKRVFCETVDVVCGVGWDNVDPDNPAFRFANTYRVVSNLGVFDFGGPERTMRALSLHPGVSAEEVRANTSFEVDGLDGADESRLPTDDELGLIREVIDPKALRDREIR